MNPIDPKNADKRTVDRYVRTGQLDEKAYDKHVKSLPDLADKTATVSTTMADDSGDQAEGPTGG
jgi:hypothetical protein